MRTQHVALSTVIAATAFVAGSAQAQSSVTLFGIVDLTIQHGSGSVASRSALGANGLATSRLGFRGSEDLGGGYSVGFWLEAGLNPDSGVGQSNNTNNQASGVVPAGGIMFNRRSTLSLKSGLHELRLGRDYNPQYRNLTNFEPFYDTGVGAALLDKGTAGVTTVRSSNSVAYLYNYTDSGWSNKESGVYASAMYYMGENVSGGANSRDGTGLSALIGYATGPLNVAAATSKTTYRTVGASGVAGLVGDTRQSNIGATYDFGVATLFALYASDKNGVVRGKGYAFGPAIPVGVGTISAAYSRYRTTGVADATAKKWALGYVHPLSKRTALYGTVAHVSNSGASAVALNGSITAAGSSSTGFDLGVRHNF